MQIMRYFDDKGIDYICRGYNKNFKELYDNVDLLYGNDRNFRNAGLCLCGAVLCFGIELWLNKKKIEKLEKQVDELKLKKWKENKEED